MTSQPSDLNQNLLTDNADTDVFFEHLEAIYNTPDSSQGRSTDAQRSALAADDGEPTEDLSEEKLLDDVMRASSFQQSGRTQEAIALYQQIYRRDREGHFGAIATKALESLGVTLADNTPNLGLTPLEPLTVTSLQNDKNPSNLFQKLLQGFYDRPLRTKQLIGLLTSEAASLIGLVGVGAVLLVGGLRSQILEQAKSELAAAGVQYNIKINQMGFGFRGQSDNAIVINAAKARQPSGRLQTVLRNEINVRSIEFATLVDRQGRIIASANRNRQGEVFDPDKLVSQAMESNSQIKVTSRISWQELQKEGMVLPTGYKPGQDALIRYVVTPVRDPAANQKVIGALIAGDIVNRKWPIVLENTKLFKGGYTAIYLKQPDGSFELVTSSYLKQADQAMHIPLETEHLLNKAIAAKGVTVTDRFRLRGETLSFAARTLPNAEGQPIAILVRGTLEQSLNRLLQSSLATQGLTSLAVIALDILIALILTRAIARPILRLRGSAEKLAEGDLTARAEVFAKDEVGQLAVTFNQMADSIAQQTATVEKLAEDQRQEAEKQRREAERLQGRVIELLTEIDGASQGDLTVRARVTDDEMGSIADAFNAALSSLQSLVLQVQEVSSQVRDGATVSDTSMGQLSQAADDQAAAIAFALSSIEQMASSIQAVAAASADAAAIARQASDAATAGGEAMEDTVESINELRTSVAETSKKVKRLTESSQEISKIVALISEISAKTNLLAFNASIEAVRAGEHGQGFRIVADEVRRLAEQVTTATKEIEQLVTGIQEETAEVLTMMEKGTSQVVKGSQLVANTRTTLSSLVEVSQQIDQLVQSISASTASQTETSQQVSYTMQSVAEVAQSTSSESQTVSKSLKQLLTVSQQLQSSVDRFRANKD